MTPRTSSKAGINVGDWIAFDPQLEIQPGGSSTPLPRRQGRGGRPCLRPARRSRIRAGAAGRCLPAVHHRGGRLRLVRRPARRHRRMVSLDISIAAPGQNTDEQAATICVQDMSGPFDYHLTHKLIRLASEHGIRHRRDVFRYYRSDSAAAVEAKHDIRTALIGFGADASHARAEPSRCARGAGALTAAYMLSEPVARRDRSSMGSLEGFTEQVKPETCWSQVPAAGARRVSRARRRRRGCGWMPVERRM